MAVLQFCGKIIGIQLDRIIKQALTDGIPDILKYCDGKGDFCGRGGIGSHDGENI